MSFQAIRQVGVPMHDSKNKILNRRQFVARFGGAVAAAPFLSSCGAEPRRVAVIGAGLSGLVAAWELRQAGVEVQVFEQSNRAGGRVWTVRDRLDDGAWLDTGAMSGGQSYVNWLNYCEKFGQETEATVPADPRPDTLLLLRGRLRRGSELRADPSGWPGGLSESEKPLAPSRLLFSHLMPVAREIGEVANVLSPPIRSLRRYVAARFPPGA